MSPTTSNPIDLKQIEEIFNLKEINTTVDNCCSLAAQDPKSLYLFMQRYAYFNGDFGSLVARLASSIGLSLNLFTDPKCEIVQESDRSMFVAAKVLAATIDEHSDSHFKDVPHRTLAQATVKAIGNYANLSVEEKNEFSKIPDYLVSILERVHSVYQGEIGDCAKLIKGMGVHAASEILASHEYAIIDKVIRYDNQEKGFDRYLNENPDKIAIHDRKINPWHWIVLHGSHKRKGVEFEHFEDAIEAINLSMDYLDLDKKQLSEWFFEGFNTFVQLQQSLFQNIQEEIKELLATQKLDSEESSALAENSIEPVSHESINASLEEPGANENIKALESVQ